MSVSPPVGTGGECPACNRYTGPVPVCPYCDMHLPLPPALRLIKAAAILLASAGLLALWLSASNRPPPALRIADIVPTMNYAQVCITGRIVGTPHSGRRPGSISFNIDDGSGTLHIFSDTPLTVPLARDDSITVTGSLKLSVDRDPILFVHSPAHVIVTQTETDREISP